ncbi:MAG: hypothetical protein H7A45_13315 [Verrucomicrobiales bacterium]|nr:hypothetical protein [Verrucomicrobiales bacterium]
MKCGEDTIWRDGRIATNAPQGLVTSSPYPIPPGSGLIGDPLVPITYGWSPATFVTNETGVVVMPVPWTVVRRNPEVWGYRWVLGEWESGRFLRRFEVVRDPALDLGDKEELFRFELDYPETLADYSKRLSTLEFRRTTPEGWVRARYQVTDWFQTNSLTIPLASQLEVSSTAPEAKWPARIFRLKGTAVQVTAGSSSRPRIEAETRVADYRYKRWNRKRIFKYAEYALQPGESWPSARDPRLLAIADDWLKNGPEYTHFGDAKRRSFKWLAVGLLVIPGMLVAFSTRRQHLQKAKEPK